MLFTGSLSGQCPDRDSLWERLVFFRDFSEKAPPLAKQLNELLRYEVLINNCPYRFDSTHALLLQRIAVLYYQKGDYINAVKDIKRSIGIVNANSNAPSVNLRHLIRSYYILSLCYGELKRMREKMNAADSCVFLSLKLNSIDGFALYAIKERVEYLYDAGDYKRSYEFAVLGETSAKQSGSTDSKEFINYFSGWIVNILITMKNFNLAGKILADKIKECKQNNKVEDLSTFYEQLAQVQVETGNIKKAQINFQLAYQYDLKMGEALGCAQTLNNLSYYIYFKHYKKFDEAINVYRKALQLLSTIKNPGAIEVFETLNIYGNIAFAFVQQGKYDSAFKNFQKAFDQIRPGITEKEILQTKWIDSSYKKIRYLVSILIKKGEMHIKRFKETNASKDIQEAIRIFKLMDQVLDKIKAGQSEIESKLFWRTDTRILYEHAIEACYLAGKWEDAFYFFEKSRAVLLIDQLNVQHLLKEDDMLKLAQLKNRILHLDREYDNPNTTPVRYAEIEKERFQDKRNLDQLIYTVKTNNPLYYQNFLDTSFITLRYAQQTLLKEHHALLEIFSGDSAVYALLVTANSNYLTKINKQDYENATLKFISYLSDAGLMNRKFNDFVKTATALYQLIFRNLPVPGNRIIISPDGQYFPFEALVTSRPGQPPAWFLNDHAVSYTYSARFLMNDFTSPPATTGKSFMGIAPVSYPSSFSLAALPGSDLSLRNISAYFDDAVTFTAAGASRSNFTEQFSKYQVIQLYTHAADSSENKEPVIYFSDSALYLSDLVNIHKPFTRLIVLSACQTGKGRNYHGEGIFSFNRGFAALGVPAAIANLWSVDNTSTYLLTELFYKHLAKGLPTDMALQEAKLEFLKTASKQKSMPCYWGGPVLIGKTDTLAPNKTYPVKWVIIFSALSLVVTGAITKWIIKKQKAKRAAV